MLNIEKKWVRILLIWIFLGAPQLGAAQGKWERADGAELEKGFQLRLQSRQLDGFDKGKIVAAQVFSNKTLDAYVAAATVWNSRSPGVTKCLLISKNKDGVLLHVPPEPDLDLPLSCNGEAAVAFVDKGTTGSEVLAVFAFESPARALVYYPLVLEVRNRNVSIDVVSTQKANQARDNGSRLRSIADLKAILLQPAGTARQTESTEGYYANRSKECTKFDKTRNRFVSCEKEFTDCLLIRKVSDAKMAIEIFSTQANQHVCALNGVAVAENGIPTYRFGTEADSQRIQFIRNGNEIYLKHFIPAGGPPENCGPHAEFDGLRFKKVDSDPGKHVCFKG